MIYDINFWIGNASASIGWLFLVYSFWKNKDDKILWFQIIGNIFFLINYIFLHAYTGLFIILFEIIREYIYIKLEDDKKTFILTLPIFLLVGVFSYSNLWSIFPILASVSDGYSLIHKGKKVVFFGVITYALWLIYDINSYCYTNVMAETILIVSNIIILIKNKNVERIIKR